MGIESSVLKGKGKASYTGEDSYVRLEDDIEVEKVDQCMKITRRRSRHQSY
jgi:hypothetical protein